MHYGWCDTEIWLQSISSTRRIAIWYNCIVHSICVDGVGRLFVLTSNYITIDITSTLLQLTRNDGDDDDITEWKSESLCVLPYFHMCLLDDGRLVVSSKMSFHLMVE